MAAKVFGIGANKTGTSSLKRAFALCGLRVGDQRAGEMTSYTARRGNYQLLAAYCETADAFQDAPFSLMSVYAALDELFPGSRFVLTVRDPEDWFRSLHEWTAWRHKGQITRQTMEADRHLYPGYVAETHALSYLMETPDSATRWDRLYDREHYIRVYERRNDAIRDHFKGRPDQLLEIDLGREPTMKRLADFLGAPPEAGRLPMPHLQPGTPEPPPPN